jgi:hypothetical protein
LLRDHKWHGTLEIISVGGTEGMRRLRELDEIGYSIERSIVGHNRWEYRLVEDDVITDAALSIV